MHVGQILDVVRGEKLYIALKKCSFMSNNLAFEVKQIMRTINAYGVYTYSLLAKFIASTKQLLSLKRSLFKILVQ